MQHKLNTLTKFVQNSPSNLRMKGNSSLHGFQQKCVRLFSKYEGQVTDKEKEGKIYVINHVQKPTKRFYSTRKTFWQLSKTFNPKP